MNMEFIISFCLGIGFLYLCFTIYDYYVKKLSLKEFIKESVEMGLLLIILFTGMYIALHYPQLLIVISIVVGITMFLLKTVFRYHICNLPLRDSIRKGLIAGIASVIVVLIVFIDLIV